MTVPDREKPKQADGRKRRSATCTKEINTQKMSGDLIEEGK